MRGMRSDEDQIVDEILVIEAQCGDRACLDLLVDRWSPRVLAAAHRLTGDHTGAEDVSQEAWGAIARGLGRLRDPAMFGPWVRGIIRRKAADWISLRKRQRRDGSLAPRQPDNEKSDASDGDELMRLRHAIRGLPPERRAVLFLLYGEGLGVAQIASLMEVPVGTVKSRLHQARGEIRGLMDAQGDGHG